jgi:hypothetical protein
LENTGLAPGRPYTFKSGILAVGAPRQDESKIVSARGIEYSKGKRGGKRQQVDVTVGREEPGFEFHQRVPPFM